MCTLLSASLNLLCYIMNWPLSILFLYSAPAAQRFSSFPSSLTSLIVIDQRSPHNDWAARWGNPSRLLHPSIKQRGGRREYSKHKPALLFPSPLRADLSGRVQVVPSVRTANLSVNVKIINTIHIVSVTVLFCMGTVLLAAPT